MQKEIYSNAFVKNKNVRAARLNIDFPLLLLLFAAAAVLHLW